MGVLGGTLLGSFILTNPQPIPTPSAYDTVKVYGGLTVDKVRGVRGVLSEEELDLISPLTEFEWTPETIYLANFNYDLTAGNISGVLNPIEKWILYRRRDTDTKFKLMANLSVSEVSFRDYEIKTNKKYIYRLFAESADEISAPLDSEIFTSDFYYWVMIDTITNRIYIFDLEANASSLSYGNSEIIYQSPFAQFPTISKTPTNYMQTTISALAGAIDYDTMEFIYPQDYLDEFVDYINNGNEKILKDPRGRGWIVKTSNFNHTYRQGTDVMYADINFDVKQVGVLDS